jgi:two-component system, OmpR family, phosphate regulon sensor histidine kinase PhoR
MTAVAWVIAGLAVIVAALAIAGRRRAPSPPAGAPEPPAEPVPVDQGAARMAAAFHALPMTALLIDADGVVADANPAAEQSFPFLRTGVGILEAFGDHMLATRVRDALSSGDADEFELRLFVEGRRTFRVQVVPFRAAGTAGAVLTLADATQAVAYQDLRSQFVANVSHELRTPLTGLRGMLEALEDPDIPADMREDFVHRSRVETERLEALINDILFLSELEAAQGDPSGERSDMGAIARLVADELAGEAAEQGVRLVVAVHEGSWTALTDRMAHTVARNLVENAVRYAGLGATATVRVDRTDGMVVTEVQDDGLGIPERHVPHVFERFYRADPSRSRRLGGTGLGLSIVKHIAERLGGSASITSREGFGTIVTVAIPAADAPVTDVPGDAGMGSGARMRW